MLQLPVVLDASQPAAPPDDSVVAGPWGFLIFILLVAAIVFLGWSMVRQFRKVNDARDHGVYDESREAERARLAAEKEEQSEKAASSAGTEQR